MYLDLLTSVTEVNSTGNLSGDTASKVTLLGAHMIMVHCNLVSCKGSPGHKAALQHVSMATLCKLLASMLSRRAYKSVKPDKAQAAELKKTQDFCKAWAVLPPVRALSRSCTSQTFAPHKERMGIKDLLECRGTRIARRHYFWWLQGACSMQHHCVKMRRRQL